MTWAKDHDTLIKYNLLLWGEMTYQSATLCATQARHYRDASMTFERRQAMLASRIFGSRKSPDIQAKRRVARSSNRAKSENYRRTTLIYLMFRVMSSDDFATLTRCRVNIA